jgi:hypothetical protein
MEVFDESGNSLGFYAVEDDDSLTPCCSTPGCLRRLHTFSNCYECYLRLKPKVKIKLEKESKNCFMDVNEQRKRRHREKTISWQERAFEKRIKKLLDSLIGVEPPKKTQLSSLEIWKLKNTPEAIAKREARKAKKGK